MYSFHYETVIILSTRTVQYATVCVRLVVYSVNNPYGSISIEHLDEWTIGESMERLLYRYDNKRMNYLGDH